MKYLKKFNESISPDKKYCPECGTQLPVVASFCAECGLEQPIEEKEGGKNFTITGKIEATYPNGQKTPNYILSSMNKTLSGTNIIFDKSINKYDIPTGKEVNIIGTTKNGLPPKFDNPIMVSTIKNILMIK